MSASERVGEIPDATLRCAVITVSDEIAAGQDENRAGPLAVAALAGHGAAASLRTVPDDVAAIRAAVTTAIDDGARVVITSGGTGVGPSDVTVDAVAPLLSYQLPGICEEVRRRGATRVAAALLSREVAGVILDDRPTFVLTAPGSRGGVRDAIAVVGPLLIEIVGRLDGAGHH